MKIERELMRGAAPLAVMTLLQNGEMYGYEMVKTLAKRTDGVLDLGQSTLYPMLYNLEAKGLIKSRMDKADTGRPRKYYRLTGKGKRRLAKDTSQWEALSVALGKLGLGDGAGAPPLPGGAA
ncbi:MAG: PadR family transcriptional regulator [Phycisphaeraceae bacterium]|nr:PadR family transcriptional regulator [Phycisphaeraceae bacterium]